MEEVRRQQTESTALAVIPGFGLVKHIPGTSLSVSIEGVDEVDVGLIEDLQKEETRLSKKVEEAQRVLDQEKKEIENFAEEMAKYPTIEPIVQALNHFDIQIEMYRAAMIEAISEESGKPYEKPQENRSEEEDSPWDQGSSEKKKEESRNVRRLCKKLYLKIASRTHPDKTKDEIKRQAFYEAKRYYKELNLTMLEDLWNSIQGGGVSMVARLKSRIAVLEKNLQELNGSRFQLKQSSAGQLYQVSNVKGFGAAAGMWYLRLSSILDDKRQEFEMLKMNYEAYLRKKAGEELKEKSNGA
jgi:hypothetical protein